MNNALLQLLNGQKYEETKNDFYNITIFEHVCTLNCVQSCYTLFLN